MEAGEVLLASGEQTLVRTLDRVNVQGMERRPRNLMLGVRSAWAAAWRRTLVANILRVYKKS